MDKKKAAPNGTAPKQVTILNQTLITHVQIIIRDLRAMGRQGKSSQEFRDQYGIADVPKTVSDLNTHDYHIHSTRVEEVDARGILRKGIVRYWLISEPKRKEVAA